MDLEWSALRSFANKSEGDVVRLRGFHSASRTLPIDFMNATGGRTLLIITRKSVDAWAQIRSTRTTQMNFETVDGEAVENEPVAASLRISRK